VLSSFICISDDRLSFNHGKIHCASGPIWQRSIWDTRTLDIGEQQLGHILTIDLSLDTLAAGIGFTKQTVAALIKEPGKL
jgi:hypothetical protein